MANPLYKISNTNDPKEIKKILEETTIFDKIEFSGITKDQIRAKIEDLENRQVPNRKVLLNMSDADVTECWFKNWLHPDLKHAVPPSPTSKVGCSREVLERDMAIDMLNFHENAQHNFDYTLKDIKDWLNPINKVKLARHIIDSMDLNEVIDYAFDKMEEDLNKMNDEELRKEAELTGYEEE